MKINIKNYNPEKYGIKRMQEGGEMTPPPADSAPEGAPAGDPVAELMAACQQALQTQDCNLAMQVCQAILQMSQGAPAEAAPTEAPVYRKGGVLSRWIKK